MKLVYVRFGGSRGIAFSSMMLNAATFAICLLLRKVPVELGFALGLFGVFGILRYRTQPIGTRDLTYLFLSIAMGMLNAVANKHVSIAEVSLINAMMVVLAGLLEWRPLANTELHDVTYDNLALLQRDKLPQFIEDLERRTGLVAVRYRVEEVDLLRDTARLSVACRPRAASKVVSGANTRGAAQEPEPVAIAAAPVAEMITSRGAE